MIVRLSLVLILAAGPAAAADGAAVFAANCAACHSLTGQSGDIAPDLKGVVGRKIGSRTDYAYSDAMKAETGTWTETALDAYLTSPSDFIPGGKMFAGAPDPAERAAVIAYLKTVK